MKIMQYNPKQTIYLNNMHVYIIYPNTIYSNYVFSTNSTQTNYQIEKNKRFFELKKEYAKNRNILIQYYFNKSEWSLDEN